MKRPSRFLRAIALAISPVFLAASMLCVCGTASASAATEHSCCPEAAGHGTPADESGRGEHRDDCNHCGHSQIKAPEAKNLARPFDAPILWTAVPTPPSEHLEPTGQVLTQARLRSERAPGPLFALKCSLLI